MCLAIQVIDFGFRVDDRFISATTRIPTVSIGVSALGDGQGGGAANVVQVGTDLESEPCGVRKLDRPLQSGFRSRARRAMHGLLFYIPRFIRHYRDRRQLGESIGHSLKSARVRMRSYR